MIPEYNFTIKKQNISDIAFEQLRENIYRGDLKSGDKLISENDIAEIMQISRQSVRKALSQLTFQGYIEKREGGDYFVREPEPYDPHNPFSYIMTPQNSTLYELMEVRIGLECNGVAMAAERADHRDIHFLRQTLAELTNDHPNGKKAKTADLRFHMGVACATHNSVHIDLAKRFYDYMFNGINNLHKLLYENSQNLEIIDKQHFKILDAVANRDKKSAQRYMRQHIIFLRSFLDKR